MFSKFLYLMLFCTCKVGSISRNTIICLHEVISETITFTPNILSNRINQPRHHKLKKWYKTSHGSEKFSQNLRASKNWWYNESNYKSGRHGWQHTFIQCKSQQKITSTDNSKLGLKIKIKSGKKVVTKSPSPCRRDWMLCAIHCRQNHQDKNKINQSILSYDEPDLCNDYISKEPGSNNRFCINFPLNCVLAHVLLNTNPLDNVDLWKEVIQPTRKPKSIGPHKSKPIKTTKKKTKKDARRIGNLGVWLYRYLNTIEARIRTPGVIIHSVLRNLGVWGHIKILWIWFLNLKNQWVWRKLQHHNEWPVWLNIQRIVYTLTVVPLYISYLTKN